MYLTLKYLARRFPSTSKGQFIINDTSVLKCEESSIGSKNESEAK